MRTEAESIDRIMRSFALFKDTAGSASSKRLGLGR